jgi:hypothetical protein
MKPQLVIRAGNKFTICEKNILPYMRRHVDLIISAISKACTELKEHPENFEGSNQYKLNKLNNRVYEILKDWKVYKGQ